jgi:PAS domain S-box-containing protein
LRAGARLLRQARLLDLTHDAILVRDPNNVVTYWNTGAEVLYGWPADEAIGRPLPELLATVSTSSPEAMGHALATAGHFEADLERAGRDGRARTVTSRWSLDRDTQGRVVGVMETDSDISERRRAEHGLAAAQAELAHVSRVATLGEMTAAVAHEINQPLAAIVTNGEVCLRLLDQPSPEIGELREAVSDMIVAGRRSSDIITRLRALFRRDVRGMAPLDLNQVIQNALLLVQHELRDNQIKLHLDQALSLPKVVGDRVQLEQVLINLMRNAMQAMAEVDDRPRDLVIHSGADNANAVVVAVEDTGEGIDEQKARRLFEPFFTTRHDGLGMGLRISRSIIENHGGSIRAASRNGPGARFEFRLPALKD